MTYALSRMWRWAGRPLVGMALGLACSHDTTSSTDTGNNFTVHCADDNGDATCQVAFPSRPFCNACVDKSHDLGCVSTPPPPGCDPNGSTFDDGSGEDAETDASSSTGSSTGDTDSSTGIPADTSAGESTGAEFPCEEEGQIDEDCEALDPSRPYCIGATCVGCNDVGGDMFCGALDGTRPVCEASTSVCAGCDVGGVGFCQGDTPACDVTGACMACSSHADCPDSACHLSADDPLVGSCFGADENVWVDRSAICPGMGTEATPSCSLAATLASIPEGGNAVVHLVAGTAYDEHAVASAATVAILGTGAPQLVGVAGLDQPSLSVVDAIVYVEGVRFIGNPDSHGIGCGSGTVWLDQSEVRANADYGIYLTAPCDITLRRASVHNNPGGGIRQFGGALVLDNAVVGQNGDGAHGPGINLQFADFTSLYSTIAGNDGVGNDSIQCLDSTGRIRNSIVTGAAVTSVDLDCFQFEFETNAIDTAAFAGVGSVEIDEPYDDFWFLDPDVGDFRVANPPFTPFGDVALWIAGDPLLDADGTMRPQGGVLGYAGADEP